MKTFARWLMILLLVVVGGAGAGLVLERAKTMHESREKLSDLKKTAALLRTRWAARSFDGGQVIDLTAEAASIFPAPWMLGGVVKVSYYPREAGLFAMRVFVLTIEHVPHTLCEQWLPDLMQNQKSQKILEIKLGGIQSARLPLSFTRQETVTSCQTDPTLLIVFLF